MDEIEERKKFGFVIADKPYGPTSHQVSAWVREMFQVEKVGHAGTLDPHVTGVLPIGLNKATRIINIIHLQDKEYVALMYLHSNTDEGRIRKVFSEFTGQIYQTVPVRAAVSRKQRKRMVHSLEILEIEGREILFRALTESGTYIRTLCVDIGDAIGTGGNMVELRRTRTGPYTEENSYTLQDIKDAIEFYKDGDEKLLMKILRPGNELVSFLPKIILKDTAVESIAHGAPLYKKGIEEVSGNLNINDLVAVFTRENTLVGIGKLNKNLDFEGKEPVLKMLNVLIERGKYPKVWKNP